jgi:hypothetical protein
MRKWAHLVLVGLCSSVALSAQSIGTPKETKRAIPAAEIAKFFIDQPKKDSPYETGPLHIVYSDGTESVETLPPYKSSTEKETVCNEVGFSDIRLAEDRQTLGWTVDIDNCSVYSIPVIVEVLRRHRVLHTFEPGLTIWDWMFLEDGEEVAVVSGPLHGDAAGEYPLYDVATGKLLSKVWGESDDAVKPNAPEWAKQLETHRHKR